MLSIDRQAEQIRRRDKMIRQLWMLAVSLLSIIVLLGLIILGMTRTAAADTVCLTKKEARHLWPRQHIYWYSSDHCWSNRRGGPPRGLRYDLIRETHAEQKNKPEPKPAQAPTILPDPTYDVLPRSRPEQDFCCWPILSELDAFLKDRLRDYVRGYQK